MTKGITSSVEITDSHVKLLQARVIKNKKVVTTCSVRALLSQTDEELVRALTDVILSKNVPTDGLTLAVPRRFTILKFLKLPSINDAEIRKMLGLQIASKVPYGIEDIVYDYQIIRKDDSGYSDVLAIIIHKDVITRYLKIFAKIGVALEKLTLSSFGILEWLNYQADKNKFDATKVTVLINIDLTYSELVFCQNRKLIYSRHIDEGAADLGEERILGLVDQIELSIGTYRKDNMGQEIQKIIIISSLSQTVDIKRRLEETLKISTDITTSFDNVFCHKSTNLASLKNQEGLAVTVGLGLLYAEPKNMVNLLPKEVHASKVNKLKKRELFRFFILVTMIILLGFSFMGIDIYRKNIQVGEIEKQLKKTEQGVRLAEKKLEFIEIFEKEIMNNIMISDLIRELAQLTPRGVSFRALSLEENRRFTIEGYAETSGSVAEFHSNLVKSKIFNDVNLQFETQRKIIKMEVTDFKIVCDLNKKDNK